MAKLSVEKTLLKAKSYVKKGELSEAKKLYQLVLEAFPKNQRTIQAYQKLEAGIGSGHVSKAELPPEQIQALIAHYNQGQFEEILVKAKRLIHVFPNAIFLYNIMGASYAALMKYDAAIKNYKHVLKIDPNFVDAYFNMGNAQADKGDLNGAINSFKRVVKIDPNKADAYYNMATALYEMNDLAAAIDGFKQALRIKPDFTEAYFNMGKAQHDMGDLIPAIDSFRQALKFKPGFTNAHYNMGNAQADKGDLEGAINSFKQALKVKPAFAEAYFNMGNAQMKMDDQKTASDSFKQALKIKPAFAEAHLSLSGTISYAKNDAHIVQMQTLHQDDKTNDDARCSLSFALAKAHADTGDLESSFAYLSQGNALRKKMLDYDIEQDVKLFETLEISHPIVEKHAIQNLDAPSELKPIFILGMPRSGTTLVEQVISSHTEVTGAGELDYVEDFGRSIAMGLTEVNSESIAKFRHQYLEALRGVSDGKSIVTDKMPQNFKYIGLILSAFPEAKIIHVKRNPAATCWSNFNRYFTSMDLGYCFDLDDVVQFYGLYENLMQFWKGHYGDRIYELDYDSFTKNQEFETRNLIGHLDLEWQFSCMAPDKNKRSISTASQQQVRQKVYQGSSQQWRKFEHFLGGVFEKL